jgi:hypothetical protein
MNIKLLDLEINEKNPFQNCKLDREKYALVLTDIIKNYPHGFVLAINNKWGTGKTTFVKMWQQYLKNQGFATLYFNAWENDFEVDPLIALISELEEIKNSKTEKIFKSIKEKASPLTKRILPAIVKSLTDKYLGKEFLKELIDAVSEGTADILDAEINSYLSRKKGIKEFRETLGNFVENLTNIKPVIFIIDELDRCRPTYAVEVLENIKHLFNVPGLVFALSIDKDQLCSAIRGLYGSDLLDAEEYLRRFIDIEYNIPNPSTERFCEFLVEYFDYKSFFLQPDRQQLFELRDDLGELIKFSIALFEASNLTLRVQEKILAHARVVISSFLKNNYLFPSLFIFLVYLRIIKPEIFNNIKEKKFNSQELIKQVETCLPDHLNIDSMRPFVFLEMHLFKFYVNEIGDKRIDSPFPFDNENKLILGSKYKSTDSELFDRVLEFINRQKYNDIKLSYLINKIELLDPIQNHQENI